MQKKLEITIVSFLVFAICLFGYSLSLSLKKERVIFFNVGQGDSILIEAKNGNQILIDGGRGKEIIKELRETLDYGDKHIDAIIASHFDADHIGGFHSVLDSYDVDYLFVNGAQTTTKTANELIDKAKSKGLEIKELNKGIKIEMGANTYIDVFFPEKGKVENGNDGSLILKVSNGKKSFLLTGDAPKKAENYVMAKFGKSIKSDVLKLGHHGSKSSSGENFLKTVDPEIAIVSAGKNNQYGHPNKEVINLLSKLKIPFLATYIDGRIEFK